MRPNVALIVLDTARAQSLSCYGYGRPSTPAIDEIAQRGALLENPISPSPWTLPAHASMFTGLHPSRHGCHEKNKRLNDGLPILPEILRRSGYWTIGLSSNSWISRGFGFARGFNAFYNLWQLVQNETDFADPSHRGADKYKRALELLRKGNPLFNLANGLYGKFLWRRYDYGARRINRLAAKLLRDMDKGRPFFLFINYLEPHIVYKAPEPYFGMFLPEGMAKKEALSVNQDAWAYMGGSVRMNGGDFETLKALYDAELRYLDMRVHELCGILKALGHLENTLLVITSDHGENVGEHGLMDHQYCLYDTLLRVPLILRLPGVFDGGKRIKEAVQTTGILRTVLEAAGLSRSAPHGAAEGLFEMAGKDAISEYLAPQPAVDVIGRRYPGGDFGRYDRSLIAIRSGGWKLIRASGGSEELYDMAQDPGEARDLKDENPDVCAKLRGRLSEWEKSRPDVPTEGEEDPRIAKEIKKRLEALGYFT